VSPVVADVGFALAYEEGNGHERPLTLVLSPAGDLAAVAQTYGVQGRVFDLPTGRALAPLVRGDDCAHVSPFPLAFVDYDGRTLLIHGTDWNRLDISDPRAGTRLTVRPSPTSHRDPTYDDPHYIDYFHGRLAISPDYSWIADDGWVWHPMGEVVTWSLADWLARNVWESEDGPSRRDLCWGDYWDQPLCWLDDRTLAVWGRGGRDRSEPEVRIFDVPAGTELHRFTGPYGSLFFDRYLFSCSSRSGTAVWDVASGELLHQDPTCRPTHYHPGTGQFLALNPDGTFVTSQLAE
jgi:hypothetical protein